jgi:hypothetical protein
MVHLSQTQMIRSVVDLRLRLKIVSGLVLVVSMISWSPTGRAQLHSAGDMQTKETSAVKVTSLKVRIVTSRNRGAGTDNVIYFDVGPVAWKLDRLFHNDFEAGDDDTYNLKVPAGLTTDEILWIRLHKKGIFGVTGTKDGFAGAWHPESVTLIVNDVEFVKFNPDHVLNSRCWFWRAPAPDHSDLDLFARSLRIRPNDRLNFAGKALGFLTTNVFKKNGISGWISDPADRECGGLIHNREGDDSAVICANGEITRKASSTDGLKTIDMRVTQIDACPEDDKPCTKRTVLTPDNGFKLARYIRVESRFQISIPRGGTARICGKLRWDTDREGWWEIHPRTSVDLKAH